MDAETGIITTIAGNGKFGFGADGGLATNSAIERPGGVTFDATGNLFIADTGNARIRAVRAAGVPAAVSRDRPQ